jgi:hypothetical protein
MPPPALRDVQRGFWASLHKDEPDPALAGVVLPSATLSPSERIGIYQTMYFWRLYDVLREDFPKLHGALGDDFEAVVRDYLAAHPSEYPSVRHLGGHLTKFLASHSIGEARPWLVDLARLERARVDAFDAPDAVPLRPTDLHTVPAERWGDLRFETIPALDVFRSRWPVDAVWAAPADVPIARDTVVRVWRQGFVVFHAVMDEVETAAFAALRASEPFAVVCAAVAEHVPADSAPAETGALLARWLEDGLVTRVI